MTGLDSRHEPSLLFVNFVDQTRVAGWVVVVGVVGVGAHRNLTTTHYYNPQHTAVMFEISFISCHLTLMALFAAVLQCVPFRV